MEYPENDKMKEAVPEMPEEVIPVQLQTEEIATAEPAVLPLTEQPEEDVPQCELAAEEGIPTPAQSLEELSPESGSAADAEPADQPEEEDKEQPEELPVKEKASYIFWKIAAAVLSAMVIALVSSTITGMLINYRWQQQTDLINDVTQNRINVLMERIEEMEKDPGHSGAAGTPDFAMTPAQVYQKTVDTVVAIEAQITESGFGQTATSVSSGTGFIVSADGYVVTNYHVVEGADTLYAMTHDAKVHTAKLIGYDSTNDIAVIKLEGENFPYVKIGSSDRLIVGDQVAAIGNPLGSLSSTLTVGYISAKDRMVTTTGIGINMLQTDAAINSGNSGGPLFNMYGEVVGITTAKYSGYTTSGAVIEGIGFAIPIDDVIDMITDLQQYGYITGAYLGVTVRDVSVQLAAEYSLPVGARVESVVSGVSADRAGVLPGDIIIDLGGYSVSNISDLTRALRRFDAGDETTITVFRSGREVSMRITFDEKPPEMSTG